MNCDKHRIMDMENMILVLRRWRYAVHRARFLHWCGNCQIRVYVRRHYGYDINWQTCPYVCEYAVQRRCSTKPFDAESEEEKK